MRKQSIYTLGFVAAILLGCKRDVPPTDVAPTPEFYAIANIDGVAHEMYAGEDDYYMYTDYEVVNELPVYGGQLKSTAQSGAEWHVAFIGNDSSNRAVVDSVLRPREAKLKGTSGREIIPGQFDITLNPVILNDVISTYSWNFALGRGYQSPSPTFSVDTISTPSLVDLSVGLSTMYESCGSAYTIRCVDMRHPEAWATFDITALTNTEFEFFIPQIYQNDLEEVLWEVNGVYVGTGWSKTFNLSNQNERTITVSASFRHVGGGRTCIYREITLEAGNPTPCEVDFTYIITPAYSEDSIQTKSVRVAYVNEAGVEYSSDLHDNPGTLSIDEVEGYVNDADGRPTKKIHITGSFSLQNATGDIIHITDADFVLAVATRDP